MGGQKWATPMFNALGKIESFLEVGNILGLKNLINHKINKFTKS